MLICRTNKQAELFGIFKTAMLTFFSVEPDWYSVAATGRDGNAIKLLPDWTDLVVIQHLIGKVFLTVRLLSVLVFVPPPAIVVLRGAGLSAGGSTVGIVGRYSRLRRCGQVRVSLGIVLGAARKQSQR